MNTITEEQAGVYKYEVSGKKLPAILYKYYSLSQNSIDVLAKNQIWASEPEDFNDLFDSKEFLADLSNIEKNLAFDLLKSRYDENTFSELWEDENKRKKIIVEVTNENYSCLFSKLGIFCMASKFDNEILWALYSQKSGFCIEFDSSKFPKNFIGPYPVNYVENIGPIDYMLFGGHISFLIQITEKKNIWSFEDEYRFIVNTTSKDYKLHRNQITKCFDQLNTQKRLEGFPPESISAIYLGFTFIKDECTKNYTTCFISSEREQKVLLLDEIIRGKLKCYIMEKETDGMVLKRKRIEINKISDFNYHFAEIEEVES